MRDNRFVEGVYRDVFVQREDGIKNIDQAYLKLKNGIVVEEFEQCGTNLLRKVEQLFKSSPKALTFNELESRRHWHQKMLTRITDPLKIGVEADFRRHELLVLLLEDYFCFRNQWFLGSKMAFKWLKENDIKVYLKFEVAMKPNATACDIKDLVHEVTILPGRIILADKSSISLIPIGMESKSKVKNIFDDSVQYFSSISGKPASSADAQKFFETIPSDCNKDQKKSYLINIDSQDIGVIDLLIDYPHVGTAYLGLLLVKETLKGQGIGRKVFQELEKIIARDFSCNKIRIAVISSNDVVGFWKKLGFTQSGQILDYEKDGFFSKIVILEKKLS